MKQTTITIYNLQNKASPPAVIQVKRFFGELSVLLAVTKIMNAVNNSYTRAGIELFVDKSNQLAHDVSLVTSTGEPVLGLVISEPDEGGDFADSWQCS